MENIRQILLLLAVFVVVAVNVIVWELCLVEGKHISKFISVVP